MATLAFGFGMSSAVRSDHDTPPSFETAWPTRLVRVVADRNTAHASVGDSAATAGCSQSPSYRFIGVLCSTLPSGVTCVHMPHFWINS